MANGEHKHLGILAAHNDILRAKALGFRELIEEAIEYHASLIAIRDQRIVDGVARDIYQLVKDGIDSIDELDEMTSAETFEQWSTDWQGQVVFELNRFPSDDEFAAIRDMLLVDFHRAIGRC